MKSLHLKVAMALLMFLIVFAATPALAGHVLDFQVLGKGAVVSDCALNVPADCTIELTGRASGTHIGHDDFRLLLDKGFESAILPNGAGVGPGVGVCVVLTGSMTITPPSVDTSIFFNVAGTVCEEGATGTPAGFNLHYRITGGTARFEGRSGGGSLTGSFLRGIGGVVHLHLHGTIDR